MPGPKILLYDIETSHNIIAKFDLHEEYIPYSNILVERHLFCAAWKLLGEKKVHSVSLLDDPKRFNKNIHDDYFVTKTLHDVLSDSDVWVAHNGDQFDLRWLNARILKHGLTPLPPNQTIDTWKVAKKKFNLNSHSLEYLGKYLGLGGKIETTKGLWFEALSGSKKAITVMETYNRRDVTLLEDVFNKLAPHMPDYVNRQLYGGIGCPRCGSLNLQSRGYQRALTQVYHRFQCTNCGGWLREKSCDRKQSSTMKVL